MQVQLRQQGADFLGLAFEQRQDPALEAFFQASDPRTLHDDRAIAQRQFAVLAVAVAVAWLGIYLSTPLRLESSQAFGNFFLQEPLNPLLSFSSDKSFQRIPAHS